LGKEESGKDILKFRKEKLMKKILILFLLIPVNLLSQEIIGNWTGTLVFGIQKIELSILIEREGQEPKASMDIPEQGVLKQSFDSIF
jgi:hypothetical protein